MKLTEEQKRIKIAEACGWTRMMWATDWRGRPSEPVEMWVRPGDTRPHEPNRLPAYFQSLNEMHEAEKTLSENDYYGLPYQQGYLDALLGLVGGGRAHSATAAQRAEAFGLTLGLWTAEDSASTAKETL